MVAQDEKDGGLGHSVVDHRRQRRRWSPSSVGCRCNRMDKNIKLRKNKNSSKRNEWRRAIYYEPPMVVPRHRIRHHRQTNISNHPLPLLLLPPPPPPPPPHRSCLLVIIISRTIRLLWAAEILVVRMIDHPIRLRPTTINNKSNSNSSSSNTHDRFLPNLPPTVYSFQT